MHYYSHNITSHGYESAHLTNEEDTAYRRLLDLTYGTELPIPDDVNILARRLRVTVDALDLVLNDFFTLQEDGWHHARADADIAAYKKQGARNQANGKRGGRPSSKQITQTNPVATDW